MNIVVIDYGMCNLRSVHNALKFLGVDSVVTSDPAALKNADAVILPGVGAFENGMKGLIKHGFIRPIGEYAATGRPLLGICLGMQFLVDKSYEFGEHEGLHLIPGEVVPLKKADIQGIPLKIPHIGWNSLLMSSRTWEQTPLEGLEQGDQMYFVHSFQVVPREETDVLAETEYGGHKFCSVIARGNVYGCQFHPEKSAVDGLQILRNFISLKGAVHNG